MIDVDILMYGFPCTTPFGSNRVNRNASTYSSSGTPCWSPRLTAIAKQLVMLRNAAPKPASFAAPRSGHLHPLPEHGNGNGNGHGATATRAAALPQTTDEKIRQARLKGYEGDPCGECGQLTLVRSGACCKCDTCGATSGCS